MHQFFSVQQLFRGTITRSSILNKSFLRLSARELNSIDSGIIHYPIQIAVLRHYFFHKRIKLYREADGKQGANIILFRAHLWSGYDTGTKDTQSSVADPGSGAFLPQVSGIRDDFFPDFGS
jgi:hypothetical protein